MVGSTQKPLRAPGIDMSVDMPARFLTSLAAFFKHVSAFTMPSSSALLAAHHNRRPLQVADTSQEASTVETA